MSGVNHSKFSSLFVVSTAILPIILFIFILLLTSLFMTGCARYEIFVPEHIHLDPPPEEVTIEQLLFDYMTDEVGADVKYKDKNILLSEVEVEEVVTSYYPARSDVYGYTYLYVDYFLSGGCKFTLKDFELMQNVQVGYILNLVGTCNGLPDGVVVITDCWAESIVGDLGTSNIIIGAY